MAKRQSLNPCDYLYYTQHELMRRRGLVGCPILMVMDLAGEVEPTRLEAALRRTLDVYPVLRSRVRMGVWSGRPQWSPAETLDEPVLVVHERRDATDFGAAADAVVQESFVRLIDPRRSPQVRVDLVRGAGRSRLCLTWAHMLMDAEGGQWFAHEVDRLGRAADSRPAVGLCIEPGALDALAERGWIERVGLFWRAVRKYREEGAAAVPAALMDGPATGGRWRFVHRGWTEEETARIRERSARWCPEGPARFGRYLAGCVLRALRRVRLERGAEAEALLVTLPMRVRGLPAARPMTGNYLVSATLCGRVPIIKDKRRLMDELGRQVEAFNAGDNDLASWAMIWMAGLQRAWQYRWLLGHPRLGLQPYASGFSYYREIDPPLREFLGVPVENFWGTTTMPVPPGWNPAFAQFGKRLNFVLSWLDGYLKRETVERYRELIEGELFDKEESAGC